MINVAIDFNPYPANIFVLKMVSAYYICCICSKAVRTNFIIEINTMNPDQTASKGAV